MAIVQEKDDGLQKHRLIEQTMFWLVMSLLSAITGIERIFDHNGSGWFLVALPALVLVVYWFVSRSRSGHQNPT